MRSVRTFSIATFLLLVSLPAFGAPENPRARGRFDALADGPRPDRRPEAVEPGPGHLRRGSTMRREERLGVPTFLWAGERGRLDLAARGRGPLLPAEAARNHLAAYAPLYQLDAGQARAAKIRGIHDTGRGPVIVSFGQELDGIPVFRDEMRMAMDRKGDLIAIAGYITRPEPRSRAFTLRAEEAVAAALEDLTGHPFAAPDLKRVPGPPRGGHAEFELHPNAEAASGFLAIRPAGAKKVWFRLADGLEPAWTVYVNVGGPDEVESLFYGYVISAADGSLLFRHDYTVADSFTYRVWADPADKAPFDAPQGTDPSPHPTGVPDGYFPPFASTNLVTLESGPISTGDAWLPAGATQTNGNNVDAYADIASPDGFSSGDLRATATSAGTFDRTYDVNANPDQNSVQRQASITQLFYTNNWLHDWYYDSGFDEASGNAQDDNYGRGGVAGDPLLAEGQDYSGRNNANMSTPPDGFAPVMQMFIFDGPSTEFVEINSPPSIAGPIPVGPADFGPRNFDITGDVVLVNDGSGVTTDGCETPFLNGASLAGKIALIDRGTCAFTLKVQNAELYGATGVLIANNQAGLITMGGVGAVVIPSLMITLDDGNSIKGNLGSGVNVRMFRTSEVDRDGTLDNQIVSHEWGHYISNRLVGDGAGLTTQMGAGLGEGWADFHALLMTVRPEDANAPAGADFTGAYPVGAYALAGPGSEAYYFGIRRAPYSTDLSINPLTFKHIENGVPLPTTAPLAFGQDGSNNAEVHNAGEIWAQMLWDCYAALLRDTTGPAPRLTFAEARQRMKDYLVAGYKMTPSAPTLLDARDAILAAAAATDPADLELFWQAFAKRGAGVGAVAPDRFSTTNSGVVESFVTGGDLAMESAALTDDVATNCFPDGELDEGETGTLTITLFNTGSSVLSATSGTVTSTNPAVSFPSGNAMVFPSSAAFGATAASLPVSISGAAGVEEAAFDIQFDDPGLAQAGPRSGSASFRVNSDELPAQYATDDVESANTVWTVDFDPSMDTSQPWRRVKITGVDHRWLGPDSGAIADHYLVSPPLQVAPSGDFSFTFRHRHEFETSGGSYWDGGVIELSTDGGSGWTDIGVLIPGGYGGILASGGGNPLSGHVAFVNVNPSYPGFDTLEVPLGTAYQGQTVLIRFRIGSDIYVGAAGWEIDDIAFTNITNTPFPVLVPHDPACDGDTDGVFDAADCAPGDNGLWSLPSPVEDLTLTGGASTSLSWSAPAEAGGVAGVTYDLLRHDSAASFAGAVCLETDTAAITSADPAVPGSVFYYLVGARNACGRTFAPDSVPQPRVVATCP